MVNVGMIWFNSDMLTLQMQFHHYLSGLSSTPLMNSKTTSSLGLQEKCVDQIKPFLIDAGFVERALDVASTCEHIMAFTRPAALNSFFSLLRKSVVELLELDPSGLSIATTTLSQV